MTAKQERPRKHRFYLSEQNMDCAYACNSTEHTIARRGFLSGMAGGVAAGAASVFGGGLSAFANPTAAKQLTQHQKRVLVIFLAGGVSQLESWDPKPATDTGGPFRAIPTSVKGMHISELLPYTAKQMHRLSIVRSINTAEGDHGKGRYCMERGRRRTDPGDYPHLGAVAAKALADTNNPIPGHIQITPGGKGSRRDDAAYLGPKYAGISLGNGQPPSHSQRPKDISEDADKRRNAFRQRADQRFLERRRTASTDLYTYSYEQAQEMIARREVFDVTKEPAKDHDLYGKHDFGRHCLLARRLLENGATFVQVSHTNYDTHHENFNFHIEQLGEFDKPFATLIDDLAQRSMLDSTLIVVMSEFGRTPRINDRYGRDHWGNAWSVALGGAGVQPGAIIGKTNKNGTAVADRQVDHRHLFHTYLEAVGLDATASFDVGGRKMPMADPSGYAIKELLA